MSTLHSIVGFSSDYPERWEERLPHKLSNVVFVVIDLDLVQTSTGMVRLIISAFNESFLVIIHPYPPSDLL